MQRPAQGEYNPFFERYINLVPAGDFQAVLARNTEDIVTVFENIPAEKHDYAYAEGKWSIKQVLLHMIDAERIMAYRSLVIVRGDTATRLDSFDENAYAEQADATDRALADLMEEFKAVRFSSVKLLVNISEHTSSKQGIVAGHVTTPRALGYVIVGHTIH